MRFRGLVVVCLALVVSACSSEPPAPPKPVSAKAQLEQGVHQIFSSPGGTFTYEAHENGRLRYSARTTYDLKAHAQVARVRYNPPGSGLLKILVKQVRGHTWIQFLRGVYRGCWIEGGYARDHGITLLTESLTSPLDVVRSLKAVGLQQNEVKATASTRSVMALFSVLRQQYGEAPKSSRTHVLVDVYADRLVYQVDGADLGRAMIRTMHLPPKEGRDSNKTKLVTIVLPANPLNAHIAAPKRDTVLTPGDFVPGTLQLQPGAGCH